MRNNIEIQFLTERKTILLSGELLIENVSVAHIQLTSILNSLKCKNITFCFKELKQCDIVGIQLLISMIKSLLSKNIRFNLINLNKSITDLINLHGLCYSNIFNLK